MKTATPGPSPPGATAISLPENNLPRPRRWRKLWREQVFDRRLRRAEPATRWLWTVLQVIPDDHLDGRLVEDGCPLTVEELSETAGLDLPSGQAALAYLVAVGLLAKGENGGLVLPGYAAWQETADAHRKRVSRRSQAPPTPPLEDQEQTPREGEGEGEGVSVDRPRTVHGKSADSPKTVRRASAPKRSFTPPSVADVSSYIAECGANLVDPDAFVDFYTSKGWKVGTAPMRNWQSAVKNWQRRRLQEIKDRPGDRTEIDKANAELLAMFEPPPEVPQ